MAHPTYSQYEIKTGASNVELWHACAGPIVTLPKKHDPVYYFPEGHLEQLHASIDRIPERDLPPLNIPSKILCEVDDLLLMVEPETDEVFSKIDLKPIADVNTVTPLPEPEEMCKFVIFCKSVTPSDSNMYGGFFVPMKHAANCFPTLDMSKDIPSQELVASDLHDKEWHFKHTLRGTPKRHLLSTGWTAFITSKKLVPGDGVIFLKEENGALRIGVRRVIGEQFNTSEAVISSEGMQFGLLATAAHSFENKEIFSVLYRPRIMKSNFVVSAAQYLETKNWKIEVGLRFTMGFEGEDGLEKRCSGTVVGLGANESHYWHNSEWRSLKVQWDEPSAFMTEKVSPWEIKPIVENNNISHAQFHSPSPQCNKRPIAPYDGLRRVFAENSSDEPLLSPPAKIRSLHHGGIDSFIGGPSNLSLWKKHGDDGVGTSASGSSTNNMSTSGNSFKLFGVDIFEGKITTVGEGLKKRDEKEKSE